MPVSAPAIDASNRTMPNADMDWTSSLSAFAMPSALRGHGETNAARHADAKPTAWHPTRLAISMRRGYTLATRVAGSDHGPVSLPRTGRTIIQYCWPGVRPLMTYSEAVEVAEPTSCVIVALENHLIS